MSHTDQSSLNRVLIRAGAFVILGPVVLSMAGCGGGGGGSGASPTETPTPAPPPRRVLHVRTARRLVCNSDALKALPSVRPQPSALRAFWNIRSHGLCAARSPEVQLSCTLRNTRSG